MTTLKALHGKLYAGNPHVCFDEGKVALAATPRRGSLLYKYLSIRSTVLCLCGVMAAVHASMAAITPDSDTILYVSCDTSYKFGENLATVEGKLENAHRKNDILVTEGICGEHVRDGISGVQTTNGGYFYSEGGPAATWTSKGYTDSDFTFEIFVKADADASLQYVANHTAGGWKLQWNKTKQLVLRNKSGTAIGATDANEPMNDGKWHHVAVVQDRTAGTMKFYVDYKLVSSTSYTVEEGLSDEDYLIIGAYSRNGDYNYNNQSTKCAYDELRLVKRALSPGEFLFQRVYPVDSDTIAYMSFDAGTNAVYDIELGDSALKCGRRARNSPTYVIQTDDVAASLLYAHAREGEGFADAGSLKTAFSSNNNGLEGFGYVFADSEHLVGTSDFTAEVFAKFSAAPSPYWGYVFFQRGVWSMFLNENGCLGCSVTNGTAHIATDSIVDGTWHHLAAVYNSSMKTFSFYLDHKLFWCFDGIAMSESANTGKFAFGGNEDDSSNDWSMTGSITGAEYDELRITKRALTAVEFITVENISTSSPLMYARFENSWSALDAGRYSVSGTPSTSGASISSSIPSLEILNSEKELLAENGGCLSLSGGTVTFASYGVLDSDSLTTECFVKRKSGGSGAAVLAYAPGCDVSKSVWSLDAEGTFAFSTKTSQVSETIAGVDFSDGRWHHVAVEFSSGATSEAKVYWDHSLVYSTSLSGAVEYGTGAGVVLGSDSFAGGIDELRISDGMLGADDMLYLGPLPGFCIIVR